MTVTTQSIKKDIKEKVFWYVVNNVKFDGVPKVIRDEFPEGLEVDYHSEKITVKDLSSGRVFELNIQEIKE